MSSHSAGANARVVPAHVRTVAGRLAALFDRDRQLADRLNAAHRRLRAANDRLCPRPAVNNYLPAAVGSGQLHREIHGAFWDYQQAGEQRRQLAFEVGELAQQLTDALIGAGWSVTDAGTANVYGLAGQQARR